MSVIIILAPIGHLGHLFHLPEWVEEMLGRDVAPGSENRTWPKQWLTNLVESVGNECLSVGFAVEIRLLFAIDFKLASFAVCLGAVEWPIKMGFKNSFKIN